MNADQLLARLRDRDPEGPLARLADLAADELLDTPAGEIVEPVATAAAIFALVRSHLDSPASHRTIEARIENFLAHLDERGQTLADILPPELQGGLADLAERPWAPDRELIVAWLDRDPVRALLRNLLQEALVAFGKKLRAPVADSRITRGLGELGRFARDATLSRTGAIGSITADLVGAVSGEVERQIERRAAEFADAALSGIIHRLASLLGDPASADEQAALRHALLEGFLELSTVQIAAEARSMDPAAIGALIREWTGRWLDRPGAEEELAEAIATWLGDDAEKPLGDLLAELGVEELGRDLLATFLEDRLRPFVDGEAFAAWLKETMEEGS